MSAKPASRLSLTALMVMSADGRVTRGASGDIYSWTSPEDQQQFFAQVAAAQLIIMGARTYEQARSYIKLTPNTLRVVLTHNPEQFADQAVPHQLEFSALAPAALAPSLAARGYARGLLVGGPTTIGAFLRDDLVDELLLTIEPHLFGDGQPLVHDTKQPVLHASARLLSSEQLNDRGTLLLRYTFDQ